MAISEEASPIVNEIKNPHRICHHQHEYLERHAKLSVHFSMTPSSIHRETWSPQLTGQLFAHFQSRHIPGHQVIAYVLAILLGAPVFTICLSMQESSFDVPHCCDEINWRMVCLPSRVKHLC